MKETWVGDGMNGSTYFICFCTKDKIEIRNFGSKWTDKWTDHPFDISWRASKFLTMILFTFDKALKQWIEKKLKNTN